MNQLLPGEPLYWGSLPQQTLDGLRELGRQREAQEQRQRQELSRRQIEVEQEEERKRAQQSDSTLQPESFTGDSKATQPDPNPTRYDSTAAPTDSPTTQVASTSDSRRRGRSPLDRLSPVDQHNLYQYLQSHSIYDAAKAVQNPPPHGFGLVISPSSFTRFKRRYAKNLRKRETAEALANARHLILESNATAASYTQASEYLLKLRLYEATTNPATDPEILARLFKIQSDLRRQTLAERKQNHAEKKPSGEETT